MSLIKNLSIGNFKGIGRQVDIELKPITLLFGQNSAGKSTVLHALNYLHDLISLHSVNADSTFLGQGSIDLGGFKQFVYNHDLDRTVVLGFTLDLSNQDLIETESAALFSELFTIQQDLFQKGLLLDLSEITKYVLFAEVVLEVSWSNLLGKPYVSKLSVHFNDELCIEIQASNDCKRIEIVRFNTMHPIFTAIEGLEEIGLNLFVENVIESRYLDESGQAMIGLLGQVDALPEFNRPLKIGEVWRSDSSDDSDEIMLARALASILILGPLEVASDELQSIRYMGPIREIPPRNYSPRLGEKHNWADGLSAWDELFRASPKFLKLVNYWLNGHEERIDYAVDKLAIEEIFTGDLTPTINPQLESLRTGYIVKIAEYKQLETNSGLMSLLNLEDLNRIKDELDQLIEDLPIKKSIFLTDVRRDIDVHPGDVGIGISQLLPVVVGILASDIDLFSVEQPELHIHPALQVALGDLLIYGVNKLGKTLIFETHSEHLLLRLMRRIRERSEGKVMDPDIVLDAKNVNIVYVECIQDETRLIPIRIGKDGRFVDRWPRGFFGEREQELFE